MAGPITGTHVALGGIGAAIMGYLPPVLAWKFGIPSDISVDISALLVLGVGGGVMGAIKAIMGSPLKAVAIAELKAKAPALEATIEDVIRNMNLVVAQPAPGAAPIVPVVIAQH